MPWMAPQDADEGLILEIVQSSRGAHSGFFHAALADGSIRFISVDIERSTLRAMLTISGDETVGEF